MKRIAAIIATSFTLLAIPATAMASTSSTGASAAHPRFVTASCRGPHEFKLQAPGQRQHHFRCPRPKRKPVPAQACVPGTVTFDMPPDSWAFTQYSGPELYAGEQFDYAGTTYSIATVSGPVFTLNADGSRYANGVPSVVDGSATVSCTGVSAGS
jgi:hypothetical protein